MATKNKFYHRIPRKKKKEIKKAFGNSGYAFVYNKGLKEKIDNFMDNEWRADEEEEPGGELVEGDDVVAYVSKSMAKDIDREILRDLFYEWKKVKRYETSEETEEKG